MTDTQVIRTAVGNSPTQATITLGEKLVASEVPNLKNEIKRLLGDGVTSIILDCTQLNVMDSTGIGCLVAAYNSLTRVNGNLSVIQVSVDIYELLCSMRLDRRIKITPLAPAQE
jgi:anti-anti-sigma factor